MIVYEDLKPVRFGDVYGRLVGKSDQGSEQDGEWSVVYFATPGGSITEMGISYLSEMNADDLLQLKCYEAQATDTWDEIKAKLAEIL